MIKAKDIMTTNVISISPDADIVDAAKLLLKEGINGAPVVDDKGGLIGIICQSDLVAQQKTLNMPSYITILDSFIPLTSEKEMEKEIKKVVSSCVEDAMSEVPVFISPDTPVEEVATMMVNEKLYTVPVLENGKVIGIIGKEDILRTLFHEEP
ncbi:MAG: CBS domain-containing protein [Desulfovibrio sp.]